MVRLPRSLKGTLRSSNGSWFIDLGPEAELASFTADSEVQVLIWDRSSTSMLEQVSEAQHIAIGEAAQGLSVRGALHTGNAGDPAASGIAPFLSRIPS
jgi:hypothetical protein